MTRGRRGRARQARMDRRRDLLKLGLQYDVSITYTKERGKGITSVRFNGTTLSEPSGQFPTEALVAKVDLAIQAGAIKSRLSSFNEAMGAMMTRFAKLMAQQIDDDIMNMTIYGSSHVEALLKEGGTVPSNFVRTQIDEK